MARGVEARREHAGVDGGDNDVFELAGRGEAEVGEQMGVGQLGLVARESEEGELAEFEGLGVVQFGEAGGREVVGVEAMGEEGEVSVPGAVDRIFGGRERGDRGTV